MPEILCIGSMTTRGASIRGNEGERLSALSPAQPGMGTCLHHCHRNGATCHNLEMLAHTLVFAMHRRASSISDALLNMSLVDVSQRLCITTLLWPLARALTNVRIKNSADWLVILIAKVCHAGAAGEIAIMET